MKKIIILFVCFLSTYGVLNAQLVTSNSLTPQQLVQQVLLGTGVTVSNITFSGNASQIARFNATASTNLGFLNGVLMSSGTALTASAVGPQGPNGAPGTSTSFNGSGDVNLNSLSSSPTEDAAVLEFDFIPTSDSVKFRYFFGSEEYPEFVGGSFNDVFGFFISGPNPFGGFYVNKNIALIPSTTTPVSINNVNIGINSAYYISNGANIIDCEFDGFTTVLRALEKVVCGQTYHIKLAIADAGDDALDSGVFLEAGSFSSIPPIVVSSSNSNASFTDSVMVEDCNTNCVYFVRNANISQKDSFKLVTSGNAILGSDYVQNGNPTFTWPNKLIFNANQDTFKICNLKALNDNLVEGTDTIIFTLTTYTTPSSACASSTSIKFKLYIKDYKPINIGQSDTSFCNGQSPLLVANASFGLPTYSYTWQPVNSNASTINAGVITQPTQFTITVNDICNKPVSKVIIVSPTTLPVISPLGPFNFCLDTIRKIPLIVTGGKPSYQYAWQIPASGIVPFDTISNIYYFLSDVNTSQGTYTIIVTDQCNKKDTITTDIKIVDCNVIVPNVVTANGDNKNDIFKINGLENFPNSNLTVFNRWGSKIYSNNNYQNDWSPDNSDGTYFYVLEVSDGRKLNGFFQLFKN